MAVTTKTWSTLAAIGPVAAALGHPPLQHGAARLDAHDARAGRRRLGLQPDDVAHHDLGRVALGLAAEHRAHLAARWWPPGTSDPSRSSTVPRSGVTTPPAPGRSPRRAPPSRRRARATPIRSSASAGVRPQASGSVSTWPTGRSPPRRPAHEEQRRAVQPADVGLVLDVDRHRVGLAVAAAESGGALVLRHVAAQRELAHRPGTDSRTTLPRMKAMLAGRSASRRMR